MFAYTFDMCIVQLFTYLLTHNREVAGSPPGNDSGQAVEDFHKVV